MRLNKLSIGIGIASLALIGSQAFAADFAPPPPPEGYVYLGASIDYTANFQSDFIDHKVPPGFDPITFRDGHDDIGWNVFLGYQFNDHYGLELFYNYFGDQDFNSDRFRPAFAQDQSGQFLRRQLIGRVKGSVDDAYIIGLVGTGAIHLTDWLDLFGKLGAGYYDADFDAKFIPFNRPENVIRYSKDFDGFALIYGVGLQWNLGEYVSLRTMYNGYEVSDNNGVRFFLPHQISLDLLYKFV